MRSIRVIVAFVAFVLTTAGCADSADDATPPVTTVSISETSASGPLETSTSTSSTTSTTSSTSTTTTTTTTTVPTTTTSTTTTTAPDPAPGIVGGLTVEIGGGSGEVIPEWDRISEPDIALYRLWYSDDPGATKALLAEVPHDTSALPGMAYDAGGGRTAYVDLRAQIEGKHCYQVSAVDSASHEGQRSTEVCLPTVPPATPSGFDVGIGGGSGEVMVIWSRVSAPDTASYLLWFSELPGGAKSLLATVAHDPAALVGPAYNAGGGRTAYIDFPRSLENGRNCYQVSAIDSADNESPRTGELCLSGL